MMSDRMNTPTIAITNVKTAKTTPVRSGVRKVPMNGSVVPMIEPPINPATAPIAASGTT